MITLTVHKINSAVLEVPKTDLYDVTDRAYWAEAALLPDGVTTGSKVYFCETDTSTETVYLVSQTLAVLAPLLPRFSLLSVLQINSAELPSPKNLLVNIAKVSKILNTTFNGGAANKVVLYKTEHNNETELITTTTVPQVVLDLC